MLNWILFLNIYLVKYENTLRMKWWWWVDVGVGFSLNKRNIPFLNNKFYSRKKKQIVFELKWHTCGCVSNVCADITIVVVLCILSSCSTGDFGGWLTLSTVKLLSDKCVPKANDSAARTMSNTWNLILKIKNS